MARRVLALSGKRFAGKDTVAALTVELARERGLSLATFAFADESKRGLAAQLGAEVELDRLLRERAYKEAWRPRLTAFTVAALARDPLVFCRAVADRAAATAGPVMITDLRLRAELVHLRARFELRVIRVTRSDAGRSSSGWQPSPAVDGHATETELDDPALWDEEIVNDAELAALRARVHARVAAWLA